MPGAVKHSPPWIPVLVYAPLLAAAGAWNRGAPAVEWAACVGSGLLGWTLLEYVLHRFAFHGPLLPPAARQKMHLAHHVAPDDPAKIVAKPWFSLPVASAVWLLASLAAASPRRGALAMIGVVLGYLAYEFVHYFVHATVTPALGAWRRRHFDHHFQDPSRSFGVTSPIWDVVFRTGRRRANSA